LDLSFIKCEEPKFLETVFSNFNKACCVVTLNLENLKTNFDQSIEAFGRALAENNTLQLLNMKDNKISQKQNLLFWKNLIHNKSLKKIDVSKTEIDDKVVVNLAKFLD